MSANSSLIQFLPDEDNQNLHVKMYKKSVQPGLICTEEEEGRGVGEGSGVGEGRGVGELGRGWEMRRGSWGGRGKGEGRELGREGKGRGRGKGSVGLAGEDLAARN